jgi:hypothetical protein
MELIIKVQGHIEQETHLGHHLNFSRCLEINANEHIEKNIISVTAALDGFTTLNAICRSYNWNEEVVKIDVDRCNQIDKSLIIREVAPSIFMIPRSKSEESIMKFPEYYISELIKVADYYKTECVHYTHYSFINFFPRDEIIRQLTILLNPVRYVSINEFVWEIDARFKDEMLEAYRYVIKDIFRKEPKELIVINSRVRNIIFNGERYGNAEIGYLEP